MATRGRPKKQQVLEINEDMPQLEEMTFESIKQELEETLIAIKDDATQELCITKKPIKNYGKFIQQVLAKLRLILGDIDKYPIMKYDDCIEYYFNEAYGYMRIRDKYKLMIKLQNFIVEKSGLPFIFDRYTIIKILQITLTSYNKILDDCYNGFMNYNEDIRNVFIDIETMLLNDRNSSAENNNANARAIDNVNRYKKENGGFGVEIQDSTKEKKQVVINITDEETQKKLATRFNFEQIASKEK